MRRSLDTAARLDVGVVVVGDHPLGDRPREKVVDERFSFLLCSRPCFLGLWTRTRTRTLHPAPATTHYTMTCDRHGIGRHAEAKPSLRICRLPSTNDPRLQVAKKQECSIRPPRPVIYTIIESQGPGWRDGLVWKV